MPILIINTTVPFNLDRPVTSLKWRTLFYQAFEVPVLDPLAEAAPNAAKCIVLKRILVG